MSDELRRVAFIGDVHLDLGDAAVGPFNRMLREQARTCDALVLMGDLFNLWVGQPAMQLEHQRSVAQTLREIRQAGVAVHYIEGNRDYRIGAFRGDLFDRVEAEGLRQSIAGRSIWSIHGDLANREDRQYRTWRRVSRSGLFWRLFNLLPAGTRLGVAGRLEKRMRRTNLAFKREFPRAMITEYARGFAGQGNDAIVLGHFHVEKRWMLEAGAEVFVLPEWKGSRRHLLADAEGVRFVDSETGG